MTVSAAQTIIDRLVGSLPNAGLKSRAYEDGQWYIRLWYCCGHNKPRGYWGFGDTQQDAIVRLGGDLTGVIFCFRPGGQRLLERAARGQGGDGG